MDGFAPAKNPDMWTQNLFNAMAGWRVRAARWRHLRLRFVRRGLQDAGFTMQNVRALGANGKCFAG
nr:MnmC family methyltransferase [Escherichia coli]